MIEVRCPGGTRVEAVVNGHVVMTDQPASQGGEGRGPSPFDLFLASVATCAGFYALRFCQERGIGTEGLRLWMEPAWDASHKRVMRLIGVIDLPEGFPEKYREAILRSVGQCAVKRHLEEPPSIEFSARAADRQEASHQAS